MTTTPSGKTLLDFGQNLGGRLRLTVSGDSCTTLTRRRAEVLADGELCTRPLCHATATDTYTLRGEGTEVFEPRLTFHGFRHAEITGQPDGFDPATGVRAVVLHSDPERTGSFECCAQLVNQHHDNVLRSMRGNFLDLPTDCPQRDERLGWTGDIQVSAHTASSLYDSARFFLGRRGHPGAVDAYALGAVADWMHRAVAGLASAEPGYRRLRVERRPGGGPTPARGPAYPARARRRTNRAGSRTAEHPGRDPAARCRAGHGGLGPAPGSSTSTPSSRLSRGRRPSSEPRPCTGGPPFPHRAASPAGSSKRPSRKRAGWGCPRTG
ncbi:family 78 glycoside hydrolase catalytic domain [Streptomyces sp. NPDC001507]|uniref:family 78 glycoside hydrolase catalytic domain n=1 Tax=Streptomyces sp. NPDC001507 TaxID=3364579 RepID=UPI0036A9644B